MNELILLSRGLFLNLAILIGLVTAYGGLKDYFQREEKNFPVWTFGIPSGLATIAIMLVGVEFREGMVMDSRVAPLAFASLLGGPLGGLVAVVPAMVMRWMLGGVGLIPGFGEILGAVGAGLLFKTYLMRKKIEFNRSHAFKFALLTMVVTMLAALLAGFLAPKGGEAMQESASLALVIIPFMFLATWVLGRFYIWDQERTGMASRLSVADTRADNAERNLEEAQKMETIGTLASGVAHDFKNILAPIRGQADLLAERFSGDKQDSLAIASIQRAADRGADLVKQMLAYARKDKGNPEALVVGDIINDCVMMLGTSIPSKVTVMRQFGANVPTVEADRSRLEQVVMNLTQNATDAMRESGGQLSLVVTKNPDGRVNLTVEDNGPGMNEETKRRVFEPFFTTKEKTKGTGLGLYVVHGIVRDLGGELILETKIGTGTKIQVLLPASSKEPAPLKPELKIIKGNGEKLLFIDDDEDLRETMGGMLRHLKYEVIIRDSVNSALEFLESSGGKIDLIISDLGMPVRNGTDLARELSGKWPKIPLVILSGDGELLTSGLKALGVSLKIEKPVGLAELSNAVHGLLAVRKDRKV